MLLTVLEMAARDPTAEELEQDSSNPNVAALNTIRDCFQEVSQATSLLIDQLSTGQSTTVSRASYERILDLEKTGEMYWKSMPADSISNDLRACKPMAVFW